jgi:hypothetical protein
MFLVNSRSLSPIHLNFNIHWELPLHDVLNPGLLPPICTYFSYGSRAFIKLGYILFFLPQYSESCFPIPSFPTVQFSAFYRTQSFIPVFTTAQYNWSLFSGKWIQSMGTWPSRLGGGDREFETVKHGHEPCGTLIPEWLRWRGPAAIVNDRPVLSSDRAPHMDKPATVWQ